MLQYGWGQGFSAFFREPVATDGSNMGDRFSLREGIWAAVV
jgi:hypothetical protein